MGIIGFVVPSFAVSPDIEDELLNQYINSEEMSVGACLAKGDLELGIFLNSIIIADGFDEGTMQPIIDLVARNNCQSGDITSLRQQRDKVRSRIREAFLTCNLDQIPSLKKAHLKYGMEIYYVRHITKSVGDTSFQRSLTDMEDNETAYFESSDAMYKEIYERFFDDDVMDEVEFSAFFREIESKYKTRKFSYFICESSSFEAVEDRWEQFLDNIGGIKSAAEDFERGVVGRAEKLKGALEDFPKNTFLDFFGGVIDMKINNLTPERGVHEIWDFLANYRPETTIIQQTDVIGQLVREKSLIDIEAKELQLRGQFEGHYKNTGDEAVKIFTGTLKDLNTAINNGVTSIGRMVNCSQSINNKQCVIRQ